MSTWDQTNPPFILRDDEVPPVLPEDPIPMLADLHLAPLPAPNNAFGEDHPPSVNDAQINHSALASHLASSNDSLTPILVDLYGVPLPAQATQNPDYIVASLPTPPTQADRLPSYYKVTIPNMRKLSKKWDQEYWLCRVIGILDKIGIKDVIDQRLDRPEQSHPLYQDWVRWSQKVERWLYGTVGPKILHNLQKISHSLVFADETMYHILRLEPNEDDRMTVEVLDLWDIHRGNYDTASEYIEVWGAQVQHCRRLGIGMANYMAVKIMIRELEDEFPVITAFVKDKIRLEDENAHQMSDENFGVIVEGLLGTALGVEIPCVTSAE
ncbi:hypothetical protein PENANT_c003G02646 [Penicillium antarcticum]|uniref:Uncharacterized protein n=1 Tax=Penicillium antarcticum TaxID=416450 RepID=A0A1V6QIK0_9EURO|nr:uncharacterized protein N7508_005735 [Penicillium antarcticum]KAJ5306720.1 hypothetical protein N7508_005735 [Penicillium antarcticum]OQD89064.1 hypothetical protein PENANT_c003G02646 [Penicillium antarcticum]